MYPNRLRQGCIISSSLVLMLVTALLGAPSANACCANYEEYVEQCHANGGTPYPWDGNRPLRCEFPSGNSSDSSSSSSSPGLFSVIINNIANAKEQLRQQRLQAATAANERGIQACRRGDWASAVAEVFLKYSLDTHQTQHS